MFLYLTTITLDILLGVTIWTVSKTYNGVYYIIYGSDKKLELSDEETKNNKETLDKLLEENKSQQIEIKKLSDNVNMLSNYIKDIKNVKSET